MTKEDIFLQAEEMKTDRREALEDIYGENENFTKLSFADIYFAKNRTTLAIEQREIYEDEIEDYFNFQLKNYVEKIDKTFLSSLETKYYNTFYKDYLDRTHTKEETDWNFYSKLLEEADKKATARKENRSSDIPTEEETLTEEKTLQKKLRTYYRWNEEERRDEKLLAYSRPKGYTNEQKYFAMKKKKGEN